MAKFSPTLWSHIKKPLTEVQQEETQGSETEIENEPPLWCRCSQCREMLKEEEKVCCNNSFKDHEHPLFENHCLTEHNLDLAMQSTADLLNYPFDPSNNACWRLTAYRQYIMWVWGKLGIRNRKVIPSFIVWKIRVRFPDLNENYTGFLDTDFQL